MKTYEIEVKHISYVTLTIEAESKDEAEQLAWDELDGSYGMSIEYIEEIEEIE